MLANTLSGLLVDGEQFRPLLLALPLFATHLQKDLGLSPALLAIPILFFNLVGFLA